MNLIEYDAPSRIAFGGSIMLAALGHWQLAESVAAAPERCDKGGPPLAFYFVQRFCLTLESFVRFDLGRIYDTNG